jgi:hypothetical protein
MTPAAMPPPGPDDDLSRLIGDAVRRGVEGPVDGRRLLAGAQRGAVRIRRRRNIGAVAVAAVLLAGAPIGLLRLTGSQQSADSTAAGGPLSAESVPAAARAAGSEAVSPEVAAAAGAADSSALAGPMSASASGAPAATQSKAAPVLGTIAPPAPGPAGSAPTGTTVAGAGPLTRTATGQVVVPDGALLTAADLPQVALTRSADSANRAPAGATPAAATCGVSLAVPAGAAGSRAVTYQRRVGAGSAWWQLTSAVRVYPGTGATAHLVAANRLPCASGVAWEYGDGAMTTTGQVDAQGRTHYYAVVQTGRTVSEITLVVPRGGRATATDLQRLLSVAAGRLQTSGLAAAAASDPALGP